MNRILLHDKLAAAEQGHIVPSVRYPVGTHCHDLKVKDEPWAEGFYKVKTRVLKYVSINVSSS